MQRLFKLSLASVSAILLIAVVVPFPNNCEEKTNPFFSPAYACTEMYGAIAYSSSSDRWGASYNFRSRYEAENSALSECGSPDCETKKWFRNACGALATGDDGSVGWGWPGSRSEAESRALRECRVRSGAYTDR